MEKELNMKGKNVNKLVNDPILEATVQRQMLARATLPLLQDMPMFGAQNGRLP